MKRMRMRERERITLQIARKRTLEDYVGTINRLEPLVEIAFF